MQYLDIFDKIKNNKKAKDAKLNFKPFIFIRGLSCPCSVQISLTKNCLKLIIPGFFSFKPLPASCGDIGFKKILGLVLAQKLGHKVCLLLLGHSCLLQTILLSDLIRCDSPLQIAMAIWRTFLKFGACQTAIIVSSRLPHQAQQVQTFKKVRQTSIIICSKLSHLTGWAALPSENIPWRLFQGQRNPFRIKIAVYF